MKIEKQTYNGFEIRFDEESETWCTDVDEKGKQSEYMSSDRRIENQSLKKLKEALDLLKRSKFERKAVFVRTDRYRIGRGEDKKYEPQYTEATLTSIAPNGNAYVVKKGEKHADKTSLKYGESGIILDTPENRKLIEQIEKEGENEWRAEVAQERLRNKLKQLDGKKAYKEVYGKEIE